jgi:hypothetical protein
MRMARPVVLLAAVLVAVGGCVSVQQRADPQVQERVQRIKTVALISPGLKVYRFELDESAEFRPGETEAAKQIVEATILEELARRSGVIFKPFPLDAAIQDTARNIEATALKIEVDNAQALFDAVVAGIAYAPRGIDPAIHARRAIPPASAQSFPAGALEDSFGHAVQRLAKLAEVDALIFISGIGHIPTPGRVAGRAALVLVTGILAFGRPVFLMRTAPHALTVGLVDGESGALLWHKSEFEIPWVFPQSVPDVVTRVLYGMPVGARNSCADATPYPSAATDRKFSRC